MPVGHAGQQIQRFVPLGDQKRVCHEILRCCRSVEGFVSQVIVKTWRADAKCGRDSVSARHFCADLGVILERHLAGEGSGVVTWHRAGQTVRRAQGSSETRVAQDDSGNCGCAFLLIRFQYKYPGTPISTITVPPEDSMGRVTIVFSVQAPPIKT